MQVFLRRILDTVKASKQDEPVWGRKIRTYYNVLDATMTGTVETSGLNIRILARTPGEMQLLFRFTGRQFYALWCYAFVSKGYDFLCWSDSWKSYLKN